MKKDINKTARQLPVRSFWLASGILLLSLASTFFVFNALEDGQRISGLVLIFAVAVIGVIVSVFAIKRSKGLIVSMVLCLWIVLFLYEIVAAGVAILLGGGDLNITF